MKRSLDDLLKSGLVNFKKKLCCKSKYASLITFLSVLLSSNVKGDSLNDFRYRIEDAALYDVCSLSSYDEDIIPSIIYGNYNKTVSNDIDWGEIQLKSSRLISDRRANGCSAFFSGVVNKNDEVCRDFFDLEDIELEKKLNSWNSPVLRVNYISGKPYRNTNISSEVVPEGTLGFTEIANWRRQVTHYTGDNIAFVKVMSHEGAHSWTLRKLGQGISENKVSLNSYPPLWFIEGTAQVLGMHDWNYDEDSCKYDISIEAKMFLADALYNKRNFPKLSNLSEARRTFATVYAYGEAAIAFLHNEISIDLEESIINDLIKNWFLVNKINRHGEISEDGSRSERDKRRRKTNPRGEENLSILLKHLTGYSLEDLDKRFLAYYADIFKREGYDKKEKLYAKYEIGNEGESEENRLVAFKPCITNDGLVMYKSADASYSYASINIIDPETRQVFTLFKDSKPGVESIHLMDDSGDVRKNDNGSYTALVSVEDNGQDVLILRNFALEDSRVLENKHKLVIKADKKIRLEDMLDIKSARFFKDGIAFVGLTSDGKADLYFLNNNGLERLTNDFYYDSSLSTTKDYIYFSSDRASEFDFSDFGKLNLDIFRINPLTKGVEQLTSGNSNFDDPFAIDDNHILVTSDINGVNNMYALVRNGDIFVLRQLSDVRTGVFDPSFIEKDSTIVSTAYNKGRFYVQKQPLSVFNIKKVGEFKIVEWNDEGKSEGEIELAEYDPDLKLEWVNIFGGIGDYDPVLGINRGIGGVVGLSDLLGDYKLRAGYLTLSRSNIPDYTFFGNFVDQSKRTRKSYYGFLGSYLAYDTSNGLHKRDEKGIRINFSHPFTRFFAVRPYFGFKKLHITPMSYERERNYGKVEDLEYSLAQEPEYVFVRDTTREEKGYLIASLGNVFSSGYVHWGIGGQKDGYLATLLHEANFDVGDGYLNSILFIDARKYIPIKENTTLALLSEYGLIHGEDMDRFVLIDDFHIRGYPYFSYNANHMFVGRAEYRQPLASIYPLSFDVKKSKIGTLYANGFFDTMALRLKTSYGADQDVYSSAGISIRGFVIPTYPLMTFGYMFGYRDLINDPKWFREFTLDMPY